MSRIDFEKNHRVISQSFESHCDSAKCYVKHLLPKNTNNIDARVIFLHGALDHHEKFIDFFDQLRMNLKANVLISTFDLVGHGLSSGSRAYVKSFDCYTNDFIKFCHLSKDQSPVKIPTYFVGHSLGAMIQLSTLSQFKSKLPFEVQACAMIAPLIKPKLKLNYLYKSIGVRLEKLWGKARIPRFYYGDSIYLDESMIKKHDEDLLIPKFITVSMLTSIKKQSEKMLSLAFFLDVPVLFIFSKKDEIVDNRSAELFTEQMTPHLVHKVYFNNSKHGLLNDNDRQSVTIEILEFFNNKKWEAQCLDT